ncbi:MAG: endonuclease [Pseudomonadales bacterium]
MKSFIPLVGLALSCAAAADVPSSFNKAKKLLAQQVYQDRQSSFYCNCPFGQSDNTRKKLVPDLAKCDYSPRKSEKRAARIEWEHVVPAWEFGHQMLCWQDGGRKKCRKDPNFKKMEADMYNLVPAVGEVNGDRSNFRFGMLQGEARRYGSCDFEVDFKARVAEPADDIRGNVARTYFYMQSRYGLRISAKQQKLFDAWHKLDPIDEWERKRSVRISKLQGFTNPFTYPTD